MGRFYMLFAVPVLLSVRRMAPLRLAAVAAVALLVLPLSMAGAVARGPGPSFADWRAFFTPALRLAASLRDLNYRFEVVPLAKHWDAYFFPLAGYPLAQGWYRQSDALHDLALREGADVSAERYAAWLRAVGVEYVFLGHAALAPEATGVPGLLRDSRQFQRVTSSGRWTVCRVTLPRPLINAMRTREGSSADVLWYGRTGLKVRVARTGQYLMKVTWSPYWHLDYGRGFLTQAAGGWLDLHAESAGTYALRFDVNISAMAKQLL